MPVELRPSSGATWFHCPGSIRFTAKAEPEATSNFAAEGTAAHTIREMCLEAGLDATDFIGKSIVADGHTFLVDDDWAEALQPGIERIREFTGDVFIEHPLKLGPWLPGRMGTLDAGVVGRKLIVISDLKFGRGVPVSPVENIQQMIYALAFHHRHASKISDAKEFLIIIDQPRNPQGGGEWRVTLDELNEFGNTLKAKVELTNDPNAPRIAGEKQCYWCPGKTLGCPEYEIYNLDLLSAKLPDLDNECDELALPEVMTPQRRSYLLRHKKMIEDWLERHHAAAIDDALMGKPVPGLKAVYGRRPPRKWSDEETASSFLSERLSAEQIFTRKLITPTKLEKLEPKVFADASKLMERGDPKPVLVSELDSRPAIETYASKLKTLKP
jgi:hypothetical protein